MNQFWTTASFQFLTSAGLSILLHINGFPFSKTGIFAQKSRGPGLICLHTRHSRHRDWKKGLLWMGTIILCIKHNNRQVLRKGPLMGRKFYSAHDLCIKINPAQRLRRKTASFSNTILCIFTVNIYILKQNFNPSISLHPNPASVESVKDLPVAACTGQQGHRRTTTLQVLVNTADSVKFKNSLCTF